jgi:4-hydroxy-3-polyprenylbenzoate decarboxylase
MPYDHLSQFLSNLVSSGQAVRIPEEFSRIQELNERARRVLAETGKAAIFERPAGAKFSAVANLLSGSRLLMALDAQSEADVIRRAADVLAPARGGPWDAKSGGAGIGSKLAPRFQKTGFSQQVIRMGKEIDLTEFPLPRWQAETAPTISNALVMLPPREGGAMEFDTPYLQAADRESLIVHWTAHDLGPSAYERARRESKPLPLAVVLGADPALQWAAQAPRPTGVDAHELAAAVRGQGLNFVRGRTIELDVPADAEIVIEGYVDPQEPPDGQGAVATAMGVVTERTDLPRMRVTAITHRANPVVPVQIRHPSPCEADSFIELSTRLLEWDLRRSQPAVTELKLVQTGEHRRVLFVALSKEFPGQARQVMHTLWGSRWLLGLKCIVVVDAGTPLDETAVWQAVAAYADPERDTFVIKGTADFDDHSLWPGFGSKLGIDATRKRPDEGSIDWPQLTG